MSFLRVEDVSKKMREFSLEQIRFTLRKGERLAIAGATGSGKTTLLRILAGWVSPDTGDVYFMDERIKRIPEEKLIPGHPGIAFLSQQFELANFLLVQQVLQYANTLTDDQALLLYKICRIDHLLERRTDQLSGGERQRVALARLLVGAPRLLLLDEPFSNLDLIHKNILKAVLHDLCESLDVSCILVSHDATDTLAWAETIIVLEQGRIIQKNTPAIIYYEPVDDHVAGLFGRYTMPGASLKKKLEEYTKEHQSVLRKYLRPENLIVDKNGPGVGAVINSVAFVGHSWEIDLIANNEIVYVRSAAGNFQIGDTVYLRPR